LKVLTKLRIDFIYFYAHLSHVKLEMRFFAESDLDKKYLRYGYFFFLLIVSEMCTCSCGYIFTSF